MLINGVHYGRDKIYRIYQGGELVWYVGDILSLFGAIGVGVGSVDDTRLTAIRLALGNADNAHSVWSYGTHHGAAFPIVLLSHEQAHNLNAHRDANLNVLYARLGNHKLTTIAYVGNYLSGIACGARVGNHFADYLVRVERLGTGTVASAMLGNYAADHLVEIRRLGTGVVADVLQLAHTLDLRVKATYQGTGVAAAALQLAHTNEVSVKASYQGSGVAANAMTADHVSEVSVKASYQATGTSADAVVLALMNSLLVKATYQGTGVGADSVQLHQIKSVQVKASCQNSGVSAMAEAFGATIDLRVDVTHEDAAHAADAVSGTGEIANQVTQKNEVNGLAFPIVPFFRNKGVRIVDVVDGTINADTVVLLSGELAVEMSAAEEFHGTVVSGVVGSGDYTTKLPTSLEGALTGGIQIVSLAADITLDCKTTTEAHLTDWRMPIQNGNDLYIHQVYTAYQNGDDLVLADNYSEPVVSLAPIKTEDGLYIRQVYDARQVDTDLILQGVEWLAPIKTEDGLYIRQAASSISIGNDLNMTI